ncbi:DUF6234 family protein [Streptacidiphilus cavernicola]|uniref:DUF6234 family protein n=1 Tax=Streptacidiphilus cavernicola TaxID=3342716 RepID=A0ABV6VZE3_9ACTN
MSLPEPPPRRRSWLPRDRAPLGADILTGFFLFLTEGVVFLWMAFAAGMEAWADHGISTAESHAEVRRMYDLLWAVLVAAALAALRRARWTAASQLLIAGAVAVMAASTQHGYDQEQQQVASESPGVTASQAIADDLNGDLNAGFLSPGRTYGGPFTEGTVVDQVEVHGGVVLSMKSDGTTGGGLVQTTVSVMLGAGSPGVPSCYRYSFTITHGSAQSQPMSCPSGSGAVATLELGRTLLEQSQGVGSEAVAPNAYPATRSGVQGLLRDRLGPQAASVSFDTATSSSGAGTVLVAAARIHGVCDFVRLGTSTTITTWVPLWQAPLDDQSSCSTTQALAADALYGTDPAQEG